MLLDTDDRHQLCLHFVDHIQYLLFDVLREYRKSLDVMTSSVSYFKKAAVMDRVLTKTKDDLWEVLTFSGYSLIMDLVFSAIQSDSFNTKSQLYFAISDSLVGIYHDLGTPGSRKHSSVLNQLDKNWGSIGPQVTARVKGHMWRDYDSSMVM